MPRTTWYKLLYVGIVAVGAMIVTLAIFHFELGGIGIAILILACTIPGRILGFFWRDLLRGLRLGKAKQYAESKRHSELFLAQVRKKPWLKHLIWLGTSSYSRDPEALALNNLGAAEMGLREFALAREHFEASIAVDALNPLPYFNMGLLSRASGDHAEALRWFEKAVELGYSGAILDKIVGAAQTRFAQTNGRGEA